MTFDWLSFALGLLIGLSFPFLSLAVRFGVYFVRALRYFSKSNLAMRPKMRLDEVRWESPCSICGYAEGSVNHKPSLLGDEAHEFSPRAMH